LPEVGADVWPEALHSIPEVLFMLLV